MKLPTLYKKAKTGAIQIAKIESNGNTITVTWGALEGKQQSKQTTCVGKNIGKANETTPEQQAELEARAKWELKVKQGYSDDINNLRTPDTPMKVSVYQDHKGKINFPCFVSPKLDGVNCMAVRDSNGDITFWSRGGEQYPDIPQLHKELAFLFDKLGTNKANGELYIFNSHLQDITSAVKKPKELSKKLVFMIFDFPDRPGGYEERLSNLPEKTFKNIGLIPVDIADNHIEIDYAHRIWTSAGFEGVVIRNTDAAYEYGVRSLDVFKYKKAKDMEVKVLDFNIDKNGQPVFICGIDGVDKTFKVKPKGTKEEREKILDNIKEYLDNWYTIEYEQLSKEGVPLKPVGIGLRKCDDKGEPIE